MKKHWIVLFILVVILGTLAYLSTWTVDKVQVEGCEIVNTQSVSDAMKEEAPLDNTLLLYIKSKMNKLKDLSFVSKMDLELTDKNTVTVTVYEKSIAGCVLYKGDYVYFDKDGIVLDSSKRRVGSAPLIKGLTFTEWSIGKKLPSDDDKKFLGFMVGTGGSAIVAKTLGEGEHKKANEYFSLLVYVTFIGGVIFSLCGMLLVRPVASLLGAEGALLDNCVLYGRICFISMPAFMLQNVFQSFFVTAEKPKLGLGVIIIAGVTNMVLDYLFIAVLGWGLPGAAIATVTGECIGGFFPIFYFARKNSSLLKLGKTKFDGAVLLKTCTNGSSELMTNLSSSLVNSLYNLQLMKYAGENGVAAYGAIMYVNFIFISIFLGYSVGSAPIVSYHYGAGNRDELKNMFKKSTSLIAIWGILLVLLAHAIAGPLTKIFVGYDAELFALTKHGFLIYSFTYLINGFNIYGSSFFTALNNGLISALISFLRTLVFQLSAVMLLPLILGLDGIWGAIIVAEAITLCMTFFFVFSQRKKYGYL